MRTNKHSPRLVRLQCIDTGENGYGQKVRREQRKRPYHSQTAHGLKKGNTSSARLHSGHTLRSGRVEAGIGTEATENGKRGDLGSECKQDERRRGREAKGSRR